MEIQTRAATPEDSAFCLALHREAIGAVITEIFGTWDPQVQERFHARWFDPTRVRIIESDHAPIGVIEAHDEADHVYLARIELLPEYQGRGIGSDLMRSLRARGRPIRLHVFSANVRARALYERLGFSIESEADGRIAMICPP
jgi:ribosomal protein S18 acetylase RimI-like enzyme